VKATLYIENQNESRTAIVDDELSIGRTPAAQLMLADDGLSRVNTTFFIEGDELLVADENSTNGTFINGERIAGRPRSLRDGDRLKLGNHTSIRIQIGDGPAVNAGPPVEPATSLNVPLPNTTPTASSSVPAGKPPYILIAAAAMTFLIVVAVVLAIFLMSDDDGPNRNGARSSSARPESERIPVRVLDPLGAQNEDSLEDLIASWETEEKELDTSTVRDVTVMSTDVEEAELAVPQAKIEEAKRRLAAGPAGAGVHNPALNVPLELSVGFRNQTRKLAEMKSAGYHQPLDFADLAAKRLSRELIEMPMATNGYFLDVGGSASDDEFTSFEFAAPRNIELPIQPPSEKYNALKRLADNFAGQRYDLNNPSDRREMRRRLLRMFQKGAKPILEKLANAYNAKFNRPLRVTSLTRSMDYQIGLNRTNANSFRVNGAGSLPPHTSGCAFDLARKHMSAEEQNFLMQMLAGMERNGEVDALIEYGASACFHIFIYYDSKPPR